MMINYICKFQNSFVYAHLFQHNLVELINKGVDMTNLFKSNVFHFTFDYDEWPATNRDTSKILAPYNDSIFHLRHHYGDVFKSINDADIEHKEWSLRNKDEALHEKVFKIKYNVNILTSMSE